MFDFFRQHANYKNVQLYNKYLSDFIDEDTNDGLKKDKKVIKLNDLLPDLIKNTSEEVTQKQIIKKVINEEEKNVVFLDSNIYPGIKVNKL